MPEFELVTKDPDGVVMSSLDESQPTVVDALRKIEDPLGKLDYLTSVSISKQKIPVAKPDTYPQSQAVYGIAVWLDVPEKANPNNFSVYVTGLSDGLAKKETGGQGQGRDEGGRQQEDAAARLPTPGGASTSRADDIQRNDNNGLGAETWMYRESSISTRKAKPGDAAKEEK